MGTKQRPLKLIFIITFFGCLLGTLLNKFCEALIPENTVVGGLFKTHTITLIPEMSNQSGKLIDLGILKFGLSLSFDVGFLSIFGILIAWYFLRYFR